MTAVPRPPADCHSYRPEHLSPSCRPDQPAGAAAAVVLGVEFAFRDAPGKGCQHLAGQPLRTLGHH
jgi:hypothetical protein